MFAIQDGTSQRSERIQQPMSRVAFFHSANQALHVGIVSPRFQVLNAGATAGGWSGLKNFRKSMEIRLFEVNWMRYGMVDS